MRLDVPFSSMQLSGFITGATLINKIILSGDPVVPLQAASKRYVDSSVNNINAAGLSTGTITVDKFPGFTGDVDNTPGTGVINLKLSGVIEGTYPRVSVDTKGRVNAGYNLSNIDIPPLNFSKFINKPTTLTGYGITDAVSLSGSVLTNKLSTTVTNFTSGLHAVTKQYVDIQSSSITGAITGDVVSRSSITTPSGFLRCNGGQLDKTTYSALYAVIGDNYTFTYPWTPGNGKPWSHQHGFNAATNTELVTQTTGGYFYDQTGGVYGFPAGIYYGKAFVTKNRIFYVGGNNGSGWISTVYKNVLATDGTPTGWVNTNKNLPANCGVYNFELFVYKNRVYIHGGNDASGVISENIYVADIDSQGDIGSWYLLQTSSIGITGHQLVFTKDKIHCIGGFLKGSTVTNAAYTATIYPNGTISSFVISRYMPRAIQYHCAAVIGNYIYTFGGFGSSGVNNITRAPINPDGTLGSDFVDAGVIPVALAYASIITTNNTVWLIGGYNYTNVQYGDRCYRVPINSDGTLGTWVVTASILNYGRSASTIVIVKNQTFLIGGYGNNPGHLFNAMMQINGFTGYGSNDYSGFYDGTIQHTDTGYFRLPDFTNKETFGNKYFIKY